MEKKPKNLKLKKMKYPFLAIFLVFACISCKSSKKASEIDRSTSETKTIRIEETRKGDSLSIILPNFRFKDTTITRYNYETKTLARVVYDSDGNQRFDCVPAEIKILTEKVDQLIKNDVKSESDEKSEFKPEYFIYALAGLALVFLIGISVIGFLLMRLQKQMPVMTAQIIKEVIK